MLHKALSLILLTPALFLAACQSSAHAGSGGAADAATIARDQGYALLYSTIGEECDIDKVLIIKHPAPPVADLIKAIGQFSRDAKATLQALAKEEPAVALDNQGLPEVETKTREAISSTTSKQILFHGGKDRICLEVVLLIASRQPQALPHPALQAVRCAA
jgi:hypothetical protein